MTKFIDTSSFSMSYTVHGEGKTALILVHGYGLDASMWEDWVQKISFKGKIIGVDLPFHGSTSTKTTSNLGISKSEVVHMLLAILLQENIGKAHWVGYSLGARWVLTFAEHEPDRVEGLVLIAPDGIIKSKWYQTLTRPYLWRRIFEYTVHHPSVFWNLLHALTWMKIIDKSVQKFVSFEMNTEDKRARVYMTWVYMRTVFPSKDFLKYKLSHFNPLWVLAIHDRIIPFKKIRKKIHLTPENALILPCGHSQIVKYVLSHSQYLQIIQKHIHSI